MLRRSLPALTLGVAMLLLASCNCGGPATTSSAPSTKASSTPTKAGQYVTVDACTLISAQDASDATGTPLTQLPGGAGASQVSICLFGSQPNAQNPQPSPSQAGVLIIAEVYADTNAAEAVQSDQVAAALGAQFGVTGVGTAKVVTGIGDKAVEYSATRAGGGGFGIFVFRSNVVMFIVVSPADQTQKTLDALPGKVEILAKAAVTGLDKAKP